MALRAGYRWIRVIIIRKHIHVTLVINARTRKIDSRAFVSSSCLRDSVRFYIVEEFAYK